MRERVRYRYSECFKREVLAALESGRYASAAQVQAHFGIKSSATIGNWLRQLKRPDLQVKVVRVEKPGEADQLRELKKQVAQLQRALGQTQAENLLNAEFLRTACERLGQDVETFKKKNAGVPSTGWSQSSDAKPP
jgi:transposase-like protein